MKLAALVGAERTVLVPVPGSDPQDEEAVKVVYRPGAITLEVAERVSDLAGGGTSEVHAIAELLETVLVSWDLENEDGTKLGVTKDEIKKVPFLFLFQVIEVVTGDSRPDPQTGGPSDDGSPQEDKSDTPPNGTGSFGQRGSFE